MERSYQLTKAFIGAQLIPDAVLTCNNLTTLGFMKAMNEFRLVVGKDIAAIGIDNNEVLDILGYNFSNVARDSVEMGRVAMRMLLDRCQNPQKQRVESVMPFRVNLKGSEKKIS